MFLLKTSCLYVSNNAENFPARLLLERAATNLRTNTRCMICSFWKNWRWLGKEIGGFFFLGAISKPSQNHSKRISEGFCVQIGMNFFAFFRFKHGFALHLDHDSKFLVPRKSRIGEWGVGSRDLRKSKSRIIKLFPHYLHSLVSICLWLPLHLLLPSCLQRASFGVGVLTNKEYRRSVSSPHSLFSSLYYPLTNLRAFRLWHRVYNVGEWN